MYNISQRANAVFAFFTTVMFTMLSVIALTSPLLLYHAMPTTEISASNVIVKLGRMGYDYHAPVSELGFVNFNLEADLRPLFNWNTKLLFVYVVAEYETALHETNQIVLWDYIITSKEDAFLQLNSQSAEYLAYDLSNRLQGIQARLSLHWNMVPWVGVLMNDRDGHGSFTFPAPNTRSS